MQMRENTYYESNYKTLSSESVHRNCCVNIQTCMCVKIHAVGAVIKLLAMKRSPKFLCDHTSMQMRENTYYESSYKTLSSESVHRNCCVNIQTCMCVKIHAVGAVIKLLAMKAFT